MLNPNINYPYPVIRDHLEDYRSTIFKGELTVNLQPDCYLVRPDFEIDNEGNPYWIVPVMEFSGIGLKRDVKAVIIFDPITGNSEKYKVEDAPTWVDHVYFEFCFWPKRCCNDN